LQFIPYQSPNIADRSFQLLEAVKNNIKIRDTESVLKQKERKNNNLLDSEEDGSHDRDYKFWSRKDQRECYIEEVTA